MAIFLDFLLSFTIGGMICVIGQLLLDTTKLSPGRILTIFVITGAFLGATGIYSYIADFAGAGATVPLTGFGYAMVKGTKEAIDETGFLGILTGPLSSASAGITTAVVCGLIASFLAKPKEK